VPTALGVIGRRLEERAILLVFGMAVGTASIMAAMARGMSCDSFEFGVPAHFLCRNAVGLGLFLAANLSMVLCFGRAASATVRRVKIVAVLPSGIVVWMMYEIASVVPEVGIDLRIWGAWAISCLVAVVSVFAGASRSASREGLRGGAGEQRDAAAEARKEDAQ
jgi:hypothetical protein